MANSFKFLTANDRVVSTTNLDAEVNLVRNGANWSSSSYDYYTNITSGSLSVFDTTLGRSPVSHSYTYTDFAAQRAIYNQFSKVLIGHDPDGAIQKFSLDGDSTANNNLLYNAFFLNFNRGQFKDKIKPGTFNLLINVSGTVNTYLTDYSGTTGPTKRESPTGEYGLLYVSSSDTANIKLYDNGTTTNLIQGFVFYEAGIAVISPYIFAKSGSATPPSSSAEDSALSGNYYGILNGNAPVLSASYNIASLISGSDINDAVYGLNKNILTASFQSVSELNSTVYFCRAFNNEFNYSSNPTYLSGSKIVVKGDEPMNQPVAYITSVGLYDENNQLLAVAKLSVPVKKTPDTELIARVRLDF